ncbi:MAG: hypothetical protein HYV14_05845 [Elusimicrobia bacterium]|nr:hypothetical protein [Elusimicrobiota bacterium]
MKTLALVFLAAAAAAAVAAPVPHGKPYWLKTYSQSPYRETWSGDLAVKKLDAALPKVVAAVEKSGGRLTQPLALFAGSSTEQQLSFIVPQKSAKALLQEMRKLGKAADPAVRPHAAPVPLDEVREKLARLTRERAGSKAAFASAPATAEAVDEMIEHLTFAEAVASSTDGEVLWNLTVKEAR